MKERSLEPGRRSWPAGFMIAVVTLGSLACEPPAPTESTIPFEAVTSEAQQQRPQMQEFVPVTKERPAVYFLNGERLESLDDVDVALEDVVSISVTHLPLAVQRDRYGETERRVVEIKLITKRDTAR